MSAVAILSHHRKPPSSKTDEELEADLAFWNAELASLDRWGRPKIAAETALDEIDAEFHRRRVAAVRAEMIHSRPVVVDNPGVEPIILMGAGKTRAEWTPSRIALVGVTAALALLLVGAVAMAGQRVAELESRYASEIV
jgi:hypothetical protein